MTQPITRDKTFERRAIEACQGINPEAVPDLLTALRGVKRILDANDFYVFDDDAIEDAIVKAEKGGSNASKEKA